MVTYPTGREIRHSSRGEIGHLSNPRIVRLPDALASRLYYYIPADARASIRGRKEGKMSTIEELLNEAKSHRVIIRNKHGKTLIDLKVIVGVVIVFGAPQVAALVFVGALLGILSVEVKEINDGQDAESV